MEQLQHKSHSHPLTFVEELEDDDVCCDVCKELISGPCYSCDTCKYFLHESCAKLPMEITDHPLHPHHTLRIFYHHHELPCFFCKRIIEGFLYGCKDCFFLLDINCSHTSWRKVQQRIQHRTHNTSLYISKPGIFSCDACGVKHKGKSYLCTCGIMVNKTCYNSPKSFQHDDHEHSLVLADCLPFEDFKFQNKCEICHEMLSREYWTYYCKKCGYFIHLKCAKLKTKLSSESQLQIDEDNLVTLPPSDESIDPITLFIKKISGQGNYERVAEFNHPSHVHPLIFSDDQSKAPIWNNARHVEQCNGCAVPILAPFYHCAETECRFFLHECCARLPNQLQLPSHHEHTLELDTKLSIGGECCRICKEYGNIFMYTCSTCKYMIDCKCASLAGIIKHEAHQHALVWQKIEYKKYCSLCTKFFESNVFACDSCGFNVCPNCAMLRRVMRHRYDEHPFRLAYSPSHLDADEFYCEICEKEMDPKVRFYHCTECDQSSHPNCISPLLQYPNWKFGIIIKASLHPHLLTLVKDPKKGTSCEKCDMTLEYPNYKCETCGFWIHIDCFEGKDYSEWIVMSLLQ
ncbi:hypothetical protein NMG60_11008439 [Bertholletia excelsa]